MPAADVRQKFIALIAEGEAVLATKRKTQQGKTSTVYVDGAKMIVWGTNAVALVRSAFGERSTHYTQTSGALGEPTEYRASQLLALLQSCVSALDNGYAFDAQALARTEVESDMIGQATQLLESNYDRAAAVVAGAVLEGHLRGIAPSWAVAVADAKGKPLTLEPLNIELKRAGAYDGFMQKRITTLGDLRNKAAHAEPFDDRHEDVERMIRDVIDICDRVRGN